MWEQGTKDDFDWERRQGETPTLRTGPNGDHTFKNGYYVYIEGSPPRIPFEVARLISRQIPSGFGAKCFTFFYFMKGKHIGYLDLHLKTASGSFINLWRKNSHQGPDWYNGAVNLPALNEPYRIVFEGQRGIGELSDIAIDDIFIDDGKCPLEDQGCSDHNPTCADWAITGECEKNKGWMMSHCCKACAEEMKCGNKDIKCIIWAKAKQCDLNKDWMWKNCCRSCRQVLDQHPKCKLWAKQGECEKNKHWMKRNCRGSCGMWTL